MLKRAYLYKDELSEKFAELGYCNRTKYYFNGYHSFESCIDKDDWNKIQSVSIDSDTGELLGYLDCSIDRQLRYAHGLHLIRFAEDPSVEFGIDALNGFTSLFDMFKFNKVAWAVSVGNPVERHYDKLIEYCNGRVVGTKRDEIILFDGTVCDLKLYEVMKSDYESSRLAKDCIIWEPTP